MKKILALTIMFLGITNTALAKDDVETIKGETEKLQKVLEEIGTKIYQQASQQAPQDAPGAEEVNKKGEDNVVDADFTAEDKDNK